MLWPGLPTGFSHIPALPPEKRWTLGLERPIETEVKLFSWWASGLAAVCSFASSGLFAAVDSAGQEAAGIVAGIREESGARLRNCLKAGALGYSPAKWTQNAPGSQLS